LTELKIYAFAIFAGFGHQSIRFCNIIASEFFPEMMKNELLLEINKICQSIRDGNPLIYANLRE
jgi:hypothetical protein